MEVADSIELTRVDGTFDADVFSRKLMKNNGGLSRKNAPKR